ncbi:hypothetical protein Tco_0718224 [Tanacetum coccineum]
MIAKISTVPVESYHTPSGAPTTSQPPLSSPSRIPTRHETEVPQSSSPTYTNVADEAAFTSMDVVHGGAATTVSSIDAGQGSGADVQDSQARRRSKIVVSDDEESLEDLSKQGRMIEDIDPDARISLVTPTKVGSQEDQSEDQIEDIDQDAGISLVTPTKVSSQEDQSEDQLGVLSAAKVLADAAKKNVNTYIRRRKAVSTGSEEVSTTSRIFSTAEESVSTAGASMPVSTAGMLQQVNIIIPSSSETTKTTNDKGKAIMQESEQPKKIKKRDDVQAHIQADEDLSQKLLEEERENLSIEERVTSFVPMDSVMEKERTKRAGLNLQEESSKRQKTKEGSEPTEELKVDEISQEDLQQMIMVVIVEEVYVEAVQKFNRDDLDKLWSLVKERFSSTDPTDDKERSLWVELKRLFEPDTDNILWKL